MGAQTAKPGDYAEPDLPHGVHEVRLSVYTFDVTGVSLLNSLGSLGTGAYHSGLVVLDTEWSYGGHGDTGESGVYRCEPELNPEYQFFDRVVMGRVRATPDQIQNVVRRLAMDTEWQGPMYDLFQHNCNHFVSDLCWNLLRRRPPDWINQTAETFGRKRRIEYTMKQALRLALASYKCRYAGEVSPQTGEILGVDAFEDSFRRTFEMAVDYHEDLFNLPEEHADAEAAAAETYPSHADTVVDLKNLPFNAKDVVALRWHQARSGFLVCIDCAKYAAHVAATASRKASAYRNSLETAEQRQLFDQVWQKSSTPMLLKWREEAIRGNLLVDTSDAADPRSPAAFAQRTRDKKTEALLEKTLAQVTTGDDDQDLSPVSRT